MKDLFLTPRGDLSVENISDSKQRLNINFITSKSNALRINFFVEDTFERNRSETSLLINFDIEKVKNDKELRVISGDLAVEQAIKIRLFTALGSLRSNEDIGSKIESVIHEFVDKESTLENLKKYIKQAISDLVKDPIIRVNKIESKYVDYSNGFTITIIDKDKEYRIEI